MDKMKFETPDLVQGNIEKIEALFPNCVTEARGEDGKLKKAVNFELLRQMLSGDVVEGDEAYEFTWVGKKAAIVEANKPIRKTLRPCPEESVDWDNTENLYIEGDNLEVLKLLQESYLGKVKLIYIDPPYNTGNDFIYRDDFAMKSSEYEEQIGIFEEDTGDRLFKNTDSNGRFHSDWCSMMYSRLMLSRNLLRKDGVIFISIDDHEISTLRRLCDDVFGVTNFVAQIIWQKRTSPDARTAFSTAHEYVVAYCNDISLVDDAIFPLSLSEQDRMKFSNPDNDPKGPWVSSDFTAPGFRPNQMYEITTPSGVKVAPPPGRCWKNLFDVYEQYLKEGRLWFGADGAGVPRQKTYLFERNGKIAWTWWPNSEVGHTQEATKELNALMQFPVFDFPKPVRLVKRIVELATTKNDLILDFFSGSATTAQAVMQLNAADNGKRKFIMVQLPEKCEDNTNAKKAGYNTICEIGKERIRRAGRKIRDESPLTTQDLDIGFRVLKLDDSNMTDVYYSADEYDQGMLKDMESNVKPDRTDLDLLFGCLLEWGLPLSLPYKSETIEGCTVHTYNDGDLIACFDENVPDSVIKAIARRQPLRAVFRDSSFASSPAKINVEEIFKMLAPDTRVKVI